MTDISVLSGEFLVSSFRASGRDFVMLLVSPSGRGSVSIAAPVSPLLHTSMPTWVRVTLEDVSHSHKAEAEARAPDRAQAVDEPRKPWVTRTERGTVVFERRPQDVMMNWVARELHADLDKALYRAPAVEQPVKPSGLSVPEWMLQQARGRREWDRHRRSVDALVQIYGTVSETPGSLCKALEGRAAVLKEVYGPSEQCRVSGEGDGLALIADKIVAEEGKR